MDQRRVNSDNGSVRLKQIELLVAAGGSRCLMASLVVSVVHPVVACDRHLDGGRLIQFLMNAAQGRVSRCHVRPDLIELLVGQFRLMQGGIAFVERSFLRHDGSPNVDRKERGLCVSTHPTIVK